jgi:hypothetical protein
MARGQNGGVFSRELDNASEAVLLEIILRLMTTGSVIVGAVAVYAAIHTHNRQIGTQIFLAYSDRLQSIRRAMRGDLLATRALERSENAELPPGALETLHLIFELFELKEQGLVKASIWAVWRRDIDRFLAAPGIVNSREQIRAEFDGHSRFIAWVEQRRPLERGRHMSGGDESVTRFRAF